MQSAFCIFGLIFLEYPFSHHIHIATVLVRKFHNTQRRSVELKQEVTTIFKLNRDYSANNLCTWLGGGLHRVH